MKQDSDRDRRVTNEDQPGQNAASRGELRRELFVVEPERLKKARRAVTEMEGEEEHSKDIKSGDEIILKTVDHHRIDVVAIQGIGFEEEKTRISHAHREMGEVIKNERENDQPA